MEMAAPWTARAPPTGPWTPGPDRRASTFPQALVLNNGRTDHLLLGPDILTYYQHPVDDNSVDDGEWTGGHPSQVAGAGLASA